MKKAALAIFAGVMLQSSSIIAHCQMPCGIYHDEMVFGQLDQYIETMYKGITMLNDNKFITTFDKNNFIRWVDLKESASNDMAKIITEYFLQQKIKPGEKDTVKRLESAHKLLFLLTAMKQNVDMKILDDFTNEWLNFKTMFHTVDYECKIDLIRQRKRERDFELKEKEASEKAKDHVDDHSHDHPHTH